MQPSPARQHRLNTLAKLSASASVTTGYGATIASAYELMQIQLAEAKRSLKKIEGIPDKAAFKQQIIPNFTDWINGVITADSGVQDDVVTTIMIWSMDAGLYDEALNIADYVLRHNLPLPDAFERKAPCIIAEEIADAALKHYHAGQPFDINVLYKTIHLTGDKDMPSPVKCRLYKAYGLMLKETDPVLALEYMSQATMLDNKANVKKEMEALRKIIKDLPPLSSATSTDASGNDTPDLTTKDALGNDTTAVDATIKDTSGNDTTDLTPQDTSGNDTSTQSIDGSNPS